MEVRVENISPLEVVEVEEVELVVLGVLLTPADSRSVFPLELFAGDNKLEKEFQRNLDRLKLKVSTQEINHEKK